MPKNPLIHIPRSLPVVQNLAIQSKQVLKSLRSFDVMQWEGTAYGSLPQQMMNIYELNDLAPRDGWPTVLMIHGGGWVSGSPLSMAHIAPLFARKGIMACSMQYRLAPEFRWPAQAQDVHAALDFLLSQQVDPTRIALWGFSAGAHLAIHAAHTYPHPLAAVVAIAPPTNLHALPFEDLQACFSQEDLKEASVMNIEKKLPPTLIIHGSADTTFPIEHSRSFAQQREEVTLWEVEHGNHGIHWPFLAGRKAKKDAISWLVETLDLPRRGSKWRRSKKKHNK